MLMLMLLFRSTTIQRDVDCAAEHAEMVGCMLPPYKYEGISYGNDNP